LTDEFAEKGFILKDEEILRLYPKKLKHPYVDIAGYKLCKDNIYRYDLKLPREYYYNRFYWLPKEVDHLVRVPFGPIMLNAPNDMMRYIMTGYGSDCLTHATYQKHHGGEKRKLRITKKVRIVDFSPAKYVERNPGILAPIEVKSQDDYKNDLIWCDENQVHEERRIYVDMIADLFHPGHVAFLRKVKELGGCLIVGICGDKDCESYKRLPILKLDERVEMVKSCRYVDAVLPNAPLKVNEDVIRGLEIDLVVHGDDFDQQQIEEYYQVPLKMGIFQTVPYTPGISTTEIIKRIKTRGRSANLQN